MRGIIGRRVRVKGDREVFKIANYDEGVFMLCRVKPGRGGRCIERHGVPRENLRFVRRKMERLTPAERHDIEAQMRAIR